MESLETTLNKVLLDMLGSEAAVQQWWSTPNKGLDGEIPDDLYHSNKSNLVVKFILQHKI